MKLFKEFVTDLQESLMYRSKPVKFKVPTAEHIAKLGNFEHSEVQDQSNWIKGGHMTGVHPAIANAIHHFATHKAGFVHALGQAKIEPIKAGSNVGNSEFGQHENTVEDNTKRNRVKTLIRKGKSLERPIIFRHHDPATGQTHLHLLAGNTRATVIGPGVEAHHIDV